MLSGFISRFSNDSPDRESLRKTNLVVPGCYRATTNRKKIADVLSIEIKKIKERYMYFAHEIVQDAIRRRLLTKKVRK